MNTFLHHLRDRATHGGLRTILFPEAHDERVLKAAKILIEEKIVRPLFVCAPEDVGALNARGLECIEIQEDRAGRLEKLLFDVRRSKVGTPDELTPEVAHRLAHDPLFYSMDLLRNRQGDGLVAGATRTTADVVRAGLWLVGKAEGIQTISSAMYFVVPSFGRTESDEVLTFADCAVIPQPSSEQLADIAIAAADARSRIVGDEPRVALLSYSTKGSGGNGPSITIVRKALELVRTKRPTLVIDGELQADAALVKAIADRKAPDSTVPGNANVLVFPSLDSANIAYKLVANLVPGAQALGPVLQGMAKPMSDLSRGVNVQDIVHIATIVAAQATKNSQFPISNSQCPPEADQPLAENIS